VGTPNNAIVYALAVYPDSKRHMIRPIDFLKYGLLLWIICLFLMWAICFFVVFPLVGFPPELTTTAQHALETGATGIAQP